MINPTFKAIESEKRWGLEGCLSIPGNCGLVKRFKSIQVSYIDIDGNQQHIIAKDFYARLLQHEIDHLNGILYTDQTFFKSRSESKKRIEKIKKLPLIIQNAIKTLDQISLSSFDHQHFAYTFRMQFSSEYEFKIKLEEIYQIIETSKHFDDLVKNLKKVAKSDVDSDFIQKLIEQITENSSENS